MPSVGWGWGAGGRLSVLTGTPLLSGLGRALSSLNLVSPSEEQKAWTVRTPASAGLDLLSRGKVLFSGASSFLNFGTLGETPNNPKLSGAEQEGGTRKNPPRASLLVPSLSK